MPEIPELEAAKAALNARLAGHAIEAARVLTPFSVRRPTKDEFEWLLVGNRLVEASRRGKYLLLLMESGHVLAVHLMLTGRFQFAEGKAREKKPGKRVGWMLDFEHGVQLRYFDYNRDGRAYLVEVDALPEVPQFDKMGPDALDPALTFEVFAQRLKKFPGQIKRSLVNAAFVAGIGNAYSDEILFAARVYPFKRARELTDEERRRVYDAIGSVYAWAMPIVAERMGDVIEEKHRDFLKVHRKGGEPCPECDHTITEVSPNQRVTSYCRKCQPQW